VFTGFVISLHCGVIFCLFSTFHIRNKQLQIMDIYSITSLGHFAALYLGSLFILKFSKYDGGLA